MNMFMNQTTPVVLLLYAPCLDNSKKSCSFIQHCLYNLSYLIQTANSDKMMIQIMIMIN